MLDDRARCAAAGPPSPPTSYTSWNVPSTKRSTLTCSREKSSRCAWTSAKRECRCGSRIAARSGASERRRLVENTRPSCITNTVWASGLAEWAWASVVWARVSGGWAWGRRCGTTHNPLPPSELYYTGTCWLYRRRRRCPPPRARRPPPPRAPPARRPRTPPRPSRSHYDCYTTATAACTRNPTTCKLCESMTNKLSEKMCLKHVVNNNNNKLFTIKISNIVLLFRIFSETDLRNQNVIFCSFSTV